MPQNEKKHLLVAAVSSRPFARAAAQAGYAVTSVDVFADQDTRSYATQTFQLRYENGGFCLDEMADLLSRLPCELYAGCVYGSGFEARPALLNMIAGKMPLLGNSPDVVTKLKDPRFFFGLLDEMQIPHPQVSFALPSDPEGWLIKHAGGSGGTHVVHASMQEVLNDQCYCQQHLEGSPVSLLFLANGHDVLAIGFNQLWVNPAPSQPFRYGGIVGNANLPHKVKVCLQAYALMLTERLSLKGLNSLDAILLGDQAFVLEINPRLSSTFDLYHDAGISPQNDSDPIVESLISAHIQACAGNLPAKIHTLQCSRSRMVVYAKHPISIDPEFIWPNWVADIPVAGMIVRADNPVCTVMAEASDADAAMILAQNRVHALERAFY